MSSNASRTFDNVLDTYYSLHGDAADPVAYFDSHSQSEVGVMQDEIFNDVIISNEISTSKFDEDNYNEIQEKDGSELYISLNNNYYDKKEYKYDLGDLNRDILTNGVDFNSNVNSTPPYSVTNAANTNDSQCNATMQPTIENHASESNHASISNNAVVDKITQATTMPTLSENLFEKSIKRKHDRIINYDDIDEDLNNKLVRMRYNPLLDNGEKNRSCGKLQANNCNGNELDIKMEITEEDKKRYEEFINTMVKCCVCKNEVSFSEIFLVKENCKEDKDYIICNECAKEKEIHTIYFKTNIYDLKVYEGQKLYNCDRLKHAAPLYQYMEVNSKGEWKILTNCCYCRLYKAQEYALKKIKQNLRFSKEKAVI